MSHYATIHPAFNLHPNLTRDAYPLDTIPVPPQYATEASLASPSYSFQPSQFHLPNTPSAFEPMVPSGFVADSLFFPMTTFQLGSTISHDASAPTCPPETYYDTRSNSYALGFEGSAPSDWFATLSGMRDYPSVASTGSAEASSSLVHFTPQALGGPIAASKGSAPRASNQSFTPVRTNHNPDQDEIRRPPPTKSRSQKKSRSSSFKHTNVRRILPHTPISSKIARQIGSASPNVVCKCDHHAKYAKESRHWRESCLHNPDRLRLHPEHACDLCGRRFTRREYVKRHRGTKSCAGHRVLETEIESSGVHPSDDETRRMY